MKAKEFDKKFDDDEDISIYLDVSKAHRPEQEWAFDNRVGLRIR